MSSLVTFTRVNVLTTRSGSDNTQLVKPVCKTVFCTLTLSQGNKHLDLSPGYSVRSCMAFSSFKYHVLQYCKHVRNNHFNVDNTCTWLIFCHCMQLLFSVNIYMYLVRRVLH